MNLKLSLIFKEISSQYPALVDIISPSIGNPSVTKIQRILADYNKADHYLIGALLEGTLIAVMGVRKEGGRGIIKHIAVSQSHRKKGIGKMLIKHACQHFSFAQLMAETDEEAVDFYKCCGFICKRLATAYGTRYECLLACKLC